MYIARNKSETPGPFLNFAWLLNQEKHEKFEK